MPLRRIPIIATALALLGAAPAHAAHYCVGDTGASLCDGRFGDIQDALDAAAANSGYDVVGIGPGEYSIGTGLTYAGDRVGIFGSGETSTVLRGMNTGMTVLDVRTSGASPFSSTVENLGIEARDASTGLIADYVGAGRLRITAAPGNEPTGVELRGSSLDASTIELGYGPTNGTVGVLAQGGGTISRLGGVSVHAAHGIRVRGDARLSAHNSQIDSRSTAIDVRQAQFTGTNLILRLDPESSRYISVFGESGEYAYAQLEHITATGGSAAAHGLHVESDGSDGSDAHVYLDNSILLARGTSLFVDRTGGALGGASIIASHNAFHPDATQVGGGFGPSIYTSNNKASADADPRFKGGPLPRLRYDSPYIDAGSESPFYPGRSDFLGEGRPVDGNGDGRALPDLGALEYQRHPPGIARASVSPASGPVGFHFVWRAEAGDPDDEELDYSWTFDDGTTSSGQTASHAFATPGRHTGTVTVSDPTGQKATATVPVDVPGTVARRFAIAGRGLRIGSRRTIALRVTCAAGETERCAGRLSLASRQRIAPRRRILTLGRATPFDVAPGRTQVVRIKVSRRAAAVLARRRKVKVVATAVVRDAAGNERTVKRTATLVSSRRPGKK